MPRVTGVGWVWCLAIAQNVSANPHTLYPTGPHALSAWTSPWRVLVAKCGAIAQAVTSLALVKALLAVSHSARKNVHALRTGRTGMTLA